MMAHISVFFLSLSLSRKYMVRLHELKSACLLQSPIGAFSSSRIAQRSSIPTQWATHGPCPAQPSPAQPSPASSVNYLPNLRDG
ncbi:hypothetical protein BGZ63DRAFT_373674 [Mariannaea sp. PMI_226]|nr:hypothetical protein BGZ63DRAFT_373674 [Mariannaea sp. PMI_226]